MADFERRDVGNWWRTDLPLQKAIVNWDAMGWQHEEHDPFSVDGASVEQLRNLGLIGVTLLIPLPNQAVEGTGLESSSE